MLCKVKENIPSVLRKTLSWQQLLCWRHGNPRRDKKPKWNNKEQTVGGQWKALNAREVFNSAWDAPRLVHCCAYFKRQQQVVDNDCSLSYSRDSTRVIEILLICHHRNKVQLNAFSLFLIHLCVYNLHSIWMAPIITFEKRRNKRISGHHSEFKVEFKDLSTYAYFCLFLSNLSAVATDCATKETCKN